MISRIRLYLLPKRKLCEGCDKDLSDEQGTLVIWRGQPHLFCEPSETNRCFFNWYNAPDEPKKLWDKGFI